MHRNVFAVSVVMSCFAIAGKGWAGDQGPNQGDVVLAGINYGGSGCPIASLSVSMEGQALVLSSDAYSVEAGPNIPSNQKRKFCQVSIDMRVPAAWQYRLANVSYSGHAKLDARTKGVLRTSSYFSAPPAMIGATIRGPFNGPYTVSHALGAEAGEWSPCRRMPINIKSDVEVHVREGRSGQINKDSNGGGFRQTYFFNWRRSQCAGS